MSGHFKVSREVWDHPAFRPGEMTQREAFFWMLSEAAWKPHTRRLGGLVVDLERGQFAASTRYMAKVFQWTEARVRRYLNMLAEWQIIDAASDAGVTVVTVCNYDKYQGERRSSDAPIDAAATQDRRTTDAREKAGKQGSTEPNGSEEGESALEIYHAECPDLPKVQKLTAKRKSALAARLRDVGGLEGWREACRRASASPFLAGENERGWRADFDFLTRESSFTKLMEGAYDRKPTHQLVQKGGASERGRAASEQRKSAWLDAVEELDGGAGGDERPERPGGDYSGHRGIAPIARTG